MDKPEIYARVNFFERQDTKEAFEEFEHKLKWKEMEGGTILDIGCGPGDVTIDYILPALPKSFERLVACDISEKMIEYAKKTYGNVDNRIQFGIMDLQDEHLEIAEQYDHVTSMFCFHFLVNKRQGVRNIYNLLKPGGDTIILYLSRISFADIWKRQSQNPKWQPYMTDLSENFEKISKNPVGEFKEYLTDAGFSDIFIESRDKVFNLKKWDDFKDFIKAIDGFAERTPYPMEEYLEDLINETRNLNFVQETEDQLDINIPYNLIIVHARKLEQL